ncbi:MAG: formyltransferase family protein [Candidatus Aenigmatarchaeota archaeon]
MTLVRDDMELFHNPERGLMNVLVLASGTGTNFEKAYEGSQETGANYSVAYLLTDKERKKGATEPIGAIQRSQRLEISYKSLPGMKICGSYAEAQHGFREYMEYQARVQHFNQMMLDEAVRFEKEHSMMFDIMLLAGYMRFVEGALWRRFERRSINVHPANLTVLDDFNIRKYTGDDAVMSALNNGESRTRSSIILVDPKPDAGAILVSGPWLNYDGLRPVTEDLKDGHQGRQKEVSDWPALKFVLRTMANGDLGLHRRKFHPDGNPIVVYKGEEMPYKGYDMEV